jgi:ornithine carbamoyltransferase
MKKNEPKLQEETELSHHYAGQPETALAPATSSPGLGLLSRDLISVADLSPAEVEHILDLAGAVKESPQDFRSALSGRQLVMFFEKPSLRTRLTFEAGMAGLGGSAMFVDQTRSRIDERESLHDIARNLERWVDGIVLRTFSHTTVVEMAKYARIPVINALTDVEHPCQALADYLTLQQHFGDARQVHLAYVGDGNNVAHSLMLTAALLGGAISVATPPGYGPAAAMLEKAQAIAGKTGARIRVLHDPVEAVRGADAVYTDVWTSMGQEEEAAARRATFAPFQVSQKLMARAARHAVFLHCLPAHRGEEVTDAVIDSPRSVVFDQAENRLHVQKAILILLLGNGARRRQPRRIDA